MRRFRRKRGGAWLPVNPTYVGENPNGKTYTDFDLEWTLGAVDIGDDTLLAVPLALDDTQVEDNNPEASMRDFVEGQEYLLNRVVGKVFASMIQSDTAEVYQTLVTAAMCVLPTEPGENAPNLGGIDWNPVLAKNAQEPWLWRRQWMLGNQQIPSTTDTYIWPTNTAEYGSMSDGGHIDSRVKRRITREHRLFFIGCATAIAVRTDIGEPDASAVRMIYDVRLNGAMRKARNRSSF